MISASHNPYYDNGMGEKMDEETIGKVKAYLAGELPYATGDAIGRTVDYAVDPEPLYRLSNLPCNPFLEGQTDRSGLRQRQCELSLPDTTKPDGSAESHSSQLIAILRGNNGLSLEIFPTASPELMDAVLKGMSHAE